MKQALTLLAAAFGVALPVAAYAQAKAPPPPPLEPAAARLWIVAPAPNGQWMLRLDNEGQRPIRIPADVRLLAFEVERADPKNPKRKQIVKCKAPGGLRPGDFPEARALLLAPGESYIEDFDPRLICFGKDAGALAGGSLVRTRFGWDPPPKWSKKPPQPPFAVQGTDHPATAAPLRELAAPSMVLSYADAEAKAKPEVKAEEEPEAKPDAKPEAKPEAKPDAKPEAKPDAKPDAKPEAEASAAPAPAQGDPKKPEEGRPEIVDANAPRLELTTSAHADASAPRRISITVTATNAGQRPMIAALRSRMISFKVEGPDKTVICESTPMTNAIPRDRFQTIKAGASTSFTLLVAEMCPQETFARAGLYRVWPTLHALETGKDVGVSAYTGVVATKTPTLVRVQTSSKPYHKEPPKAVPTPKLAPAEDDEQS